MEMLLTILTLMLFCTVFYFAICIEEIIMEQITGKGIIEQIQEWIQNH